ncbi:interleukin-1 receptor-like 1 isoform X1 [Piliocolobus tephrosceles]|uniref:Interleukin-1 receptor-like 1 n=1 Tax=Piliocolobus tephrosceles TaxID=591936 RepID=A0A8C9HCE1_9PRIM|nr:interleukin-1 receptor-like 1 isoform X1 [Piliocolobus tephrosceles]XP_023067101.1 interleukin-1 receptor-like 1 isoform X1 [Piliocolobus tephrosceles]XP_023067102.1 interleukin-1 receptor-like 1 isoform X1 [Piliocolobus tephrosceles]XP_023067103.1 interleukin-1 receptor-like 1 isoform X1 [Piliocolobus tephrosceles]
MGLCILAILTILVYSTAAKFSKQSWGLENEALIVRCPRRGKPSYIVDWYDSQTNKSIPTQGRHRVFASGQLLKFLPAEVADSGIYTCIVRSPTFNRTGYANVTIYKKQPDCNVPDYLMYSTVSGSEKNSKIYCPTIDLYNWTAPLEWFKNCQALQGSRYKAHKSFLVIDNVMTDDAGDYTCKFIHNENGANYSVTATRSFTVKDEQGSSLFPIIRAPTHNETKEVEIGENTNLTCFACFGRGAQFFAAVLWQLNGKKITDFGEPRIQQEEGQNQSFSDGLACVNMVLRIADVKEEDLLLRYDCLALNLHGLRRHTVRLSRKNPIDHQSTYCIIAVCSVLLMLINVLVIILKTFWIEATLLWRDIAKPYKTRNDGKLYDAYVIYPRNYTSSTDGASRVEYFVHQILPDVLENKCGYTLCIYGRDMLPGEDVVTAVETNIRKSRRHIFILTPQITHSEEFAYEQEVALHSALIQNDSKVILIEMEALSELDMLQAEALQDSLRHLMKVQGTIKWREDHIANKRSLNSKFWKHVRYQMPVPSKIPRKASSLTSLAAQKQ